MYKRKTRKKQIHAFNHNNNNNNANNNHMLLSIIIIYEYYHIIITKYIFKCMFIFENVK